MLFVFLYYLGCVLCVCLLFVFFLLGGSAWMLNCWVIFPDLKSNMAFSWWLVNLPLWKQVTTSWCFSLSWNSIKAGGVFPSYLPPPGSSTFLQVRASRKKTFTSHYFRSKYSDLTWPISTKRWFSKENLLLSGKSGADYLDDGFSAGFVTDFLFPWDEFHHGFHQHLEMCIFFPSTCWKQIYHGPPKPWKIKVLAT